MNIACFGEILWDNFKTGKKAGGAPMNVALHLHRQGAESRLISSIGQDESGSGLVSFIKGYGLNTGLIQTHPALPTGQVEVELDKAGHATYTITRPVAWDEIIFREDLESAARQADAIVFGSLASRLPSSRETLLKLLSLSKVKIFDMNLRPPHFDDRTLSVLLSNTDVLKINEDELAFLVKLYDLSSETTAELITELSTACEVGTICLTMGQHGAMVLYKDKIYRHPGFRIKVADTVGAGDAFLATFVRNFLARESPWLVLERACAAGAIVASRAGANPEYSADEINNHSLHLNPEPQQ